MRRLIVLIMLLTLAAATVWAAPMSELNCPVPIKGPVSTYPLDSN